MANFIAIAGNMGVGKSTLTLRLSKRLGLSAYLEPDTQNPYLADFYTDMKRWGFHSQVFFLVHRLRQQAEFLKEGTNVIQDRSIFENAEVFARNLYEQGVLTSRDWQTYQIIYQTLITMLPSPNLIIYLRASVPTLLERIVRRGRVYERAAHPDYLRDLNRLYDLWADNFGLVPILKVDTDKINFVQDDQALENLIQDIVHLLPQKSLPLYPVSSSVNI